MPNKSRLTILLAVGGLLMKRNGGLTMALYVLLFFTQWPIPISINLFAHLNDRSIWR